MIGEEQLEILHACYDEAKRILIARRTQLEALAARLLAQEKLDGKDLLEILGPRPEAATASAGAPSAVAATSPAPASA